MEDSVDFLRLFHSILRYGVLLTVGAAGIVALVGFIRKSHIITWERTLSIVAVVMCHVQLIVGLIFYATRYQKLEKWNANMPASDYYRFAKYTHPAMMILVIALVTIGRATSKRAQTEPGKQLRVAIFYLIAFALMMWFTPWPFTEMGKGRSWL